jgi:hypothetical protein
MPDWRGCAVAIVASGPSAKKAGVDKLRGRLPVIAIKDNVDLCPWADMVYGCDAAWWKLRSGLPDFDGLKVCWEGDNDHRPPPFPDIHRVRIEIKAHRLLFGEPGVIGSGGNSGFQAVNIAAQCGAPRLLLVGFDMHSRSGLHWYGKNRGQGRHNPDESCFRRWIVAFTNSAEDLRKSGIEVVNASAHSAMQAFTKDSVENALCNWGL